MGGSDEFPTLALSRTRLRLFQRAASPTTDSGTTSMVEGNFRAVSENPHIASRNSGANCSRVAL